MDSLELFKKSGEVATKFIEGIKSDQWDKLSNCAPWTIKDLVNHLTSESLWAPPLVEGKTIAEVGDKFDGDVVGDNPIQSFKGALAKSTKAFESPEAMEKTIHLSYGDFLGKSYCKDLATDLLIHGWDVAASTSQKDDLPEELVKEVWNLVKPSLKEIQKSGMFGTPVEISEEGSLQTKLLAALGRDRKKYFKA